MVIASAETTVHNCFPDYAHRVKAPKWIESQASDEEREAACSAFKEGTDFKLP